MPTVRPLSGLPPRSVDQTKDSAEERQQPGGRRREKDKKGAPGASAVAAVDTIEKSQEVVSVSQPIDSSTLVELLPTQIQRPLGSRSYLHKLQRPESVKELPSPVKLNKAV